MTYCLHCEAARLQSALQTFSPDGTKLFGSAMASATNGLAQFAGEIRPDTVPAAARLAGTPRARISANQSE